MSTEQDQIEALRAELAGERERWAKAIKLVLLHAYDPGLPLTELVGDSAIAADMLRALAPVIMCKHMWLEEMEKRFTAEVSVKELGRWKAEAKQAFTAIEDALDAAVTVDDRRRYLGKGTAAILTDLFARVRLLETALDAAKQRIKGLIFATNRYTKTEMVLDAVNDYVKELEPRTEKAERKLATLSLHWNQIEGALYADLPSDSWLLPRLKIIQQLIASDPVPKDKPPDICSVCGRDVQECKGGEDCLSIPPVSGQQIGKWRVGAKVPLNVYDGDRPVCQCHTAIDAARIVSALNGLIQQPEGRALEGN